MKNEIYDDEVLEFNAIITHCRYYNEKTNWGVYMFSTEDDIPKYVTQSDDSDFDCSNNKKFSSLAGKVQELTIGMEYLVKAKYKYDKNYGDQYTPITVYALVPKTRESQMIFLKSIISEKLADNILNEYPGVVNDVINGNADKIDYKKIRGVGEYTWNMIKEKILNNYLISDIINMLSPIGVTYTMIRKLLDEEPNPSLLKKQLEENPYFLTKINGVGFKKIDGLVLKMKPEMYNSVERLSAFVKYYFTELGEKYGGTWCGIDILKNEIGNNIVECYDKVDWLLKNEDFLYIEDDRIGLKHYHDVEMKIFEILKSKINDKTSIQLSDEQIDYAIQQAQKEQGFEYSDEQINVIYKTLKRTVSIITGKAGTGKSSIMRAIIKSYKNNSYSIVSSALSAMAAQRISEATGTPATTIHRALGCKGFNKFSCNKDNPMIVDVAYIDEGSMVNAYLFLKWLEAIGDNTRIIISGDYKQLPPIGYGNVFSDLIDLLHDDCVNELNKPMRQAEKSGILVDANLIRENINPIPLLDSSKIIHGDLKDMYYMFRTSRRSLNDIAMKTYFQTIKTEGIDNVAIVVPRKNGCLNSTSEINKYIQEKLLGDENRSISGYENTFKLGAKVMQTVNDYDKNVFNGEIGCITDIKEICEKNKKTNICVVTFPDNKVVEYNKTELKNLDLAYAMTVHKIQGGSRNVIIGIIDNTHYQLLDNCILYTLLTRAKKRCLLLAEPQAFLKCIKTSYNSRNTWLSIVNK